MAADGTIPARGEVVVVIGWAAAVVDEAHAEAGLADARARGERPAAAGSALPDAPRQVSKQNGIPRRGLYNAERHKAADRIEDEGAS